MFAYCVAVVIDTLYPPVNKARLKMRDGGGMAQAHSQSQSPRGAGGGAASVGGVARPEEGAHVGDVGDDGDDAGKG